MRGRAADEGDQLCIAFVAWPWQVLPRDQVGQRALGIDVACQADRIHHALDIAGGREHVEEDARRRPRIVAGQLHPPAGLERQVAGPHRNAADRLAKPRQPQPGIARKRQAHHLHVGSVGIGLHAGEDVRQGSGIGKRSRAGGKPARRGKGCAVNPQVAGQAKVVLQVPFVDHHRVIGQVLPDTG